MPSFGLPSARAAASRRNGAKSRGPKTPEAKARSAQNALKHGLHAQKFVLLHDEDAGTFEAPANALANDLAPVGALQAVLARRLVVAAWRLERADRIESELFALQAERGERGWGRLGLALVRDGNGPGAFDTLLRYRALPRPRCASNQSDPKSAQILAKSRHYRLTNPGPDALRPALPRRAMPRAGLPASRPTE